MLRILQFKSRQASERPITENKADIAVLTYHVPMDDR